MKRMNGGFGSGLEIRVEVFSSPAPFDAATGELVSEKWQTELEKTMSGLVDWTTLLQQHQQQLTEKR
jgi:hypothetical protein